MTRAFVLALALLCAACATERHTTVVERPAVHAVVVPPSDAQVAAESRAACSGYGLQPATPTFERCVAKEFAARRPG
jgi:hypothetical protein